MSKWVSLLRGVNVGKTRIKMADLRAAYEDLGFADVQSYVQSGNLIFSAEGEATTLAKQIREMISERFGFDLPSMVLPAAALGEALADNPFADLVEEPKQLHIFFLSDQPTAAAVEALNQDETARTQDEQLYVSRNRLYFFCPGSFARTKFTSKKLERLLGVDMTARNLRTVTKLNEMVQPL